jgi:signal transduction histidine kinase
MTEDGGPWGVWPDVAGPATLGMSADSTRGDGQISKALAVLGRYARNMAQTLSLERHDLPVDGTLRGIVLLFRVLGWAWMAILVVLTPSNDPGADMVIVWGTLALCTAWTAATWWAAITTDKLGERWFVIGDVLVTLFVGVAPTIAGAQDLFHGGWLNSNLFVVAYAYNMRFAIGAGIVIGLQQVLVHWIDDRGVVPGAGSVGFVAIAILVGWAFDHLRHQERRRIATQEELDSAIAIQARHIERLDIANRLHDSVLQTLAALRQESDDPNQVRYLARRQERQLRRTISEYRSPFAHSARADMEGICDEVEDLYHVEIAAVVRGDAEMDDAKETVLAAAREALINAAKHSGAGNIDLYAEIDAARVQVFVRDRGRGFELDASDRLVNHGLQARAEAVGAEVRIESEPGAGTEVEILLEGS